MWARQASGGREGAEGTGFGNRVGASLELNVGETEDVGSLRDWWGFVVFKHLARSPAAQAACGLFVLPSCVVVPREQSFPFSTRPPGRVAVAVPAAWVYEG